MYDGEDIIAELDSEGNVEALYLHGPGIDEPLAMARDINHNGEIEDSELFIFARNHLCSVMALVDSTGKIAQRYVYSAYGKTKVLKTHEGAAFIKNPYAYTSRELDEETGDYYYRARYYNPNSGRFLSEDPIGFVSGDTNLYRYVKNNPIALTDPSGNGPIAGGVCAIIDVGANAALGTVDYMNHMRNAGVYQEQINNINHQLSNMPTGDGNSCPSNSSDRARLQSQLAVLKMQMAGEVALATNAIAEAIGGTVAGGLICGGLLALPIP